MNKLPERVYSALAVLERIYPFIATLSYLFMFLESISYVGFIKQFVYFDSHFFFALILALSLLLRLPKLSKKKETSNSIFTTFVSMNYLLLPVVFFVYYALILLESTNYTNYVYSRYHIQLENFKLIVIANAFIVVSDIFLRKSLLSYISSKIKPYYRYFNISSKPKLYTYEFIKSHKKQSLHASIRFLLNVLLSNSYLIFLVWLIFSLAINLVNVSEIVIQNSAYMIHHPLATYEEKMVRTWGDFYTFMSFVKDHTQESSTIIIPPAQNHWLTSGNSVLVRYFLFPRKVVNLKETSSNDTLYQMPNVDADYVLLDKGNWTDKTVSYGWPKVELPVSAVVYFNPSDKSVNAVKMDLYKPQDHENRDVWGLLVLRKKEL